MPRIYVPRLDVFDYAGFHRYFLTLCTFDRTRTFVDRAVVDPVASQLLQTAATHRFAIFAYCFMPDHLHALVGGEHETADFREYVRLFKQRTAFEWKRRHGGALWQRGYFDHVLRDEEDVLGVARYILENPVRVE